MSEEEIEKMKSEAQANEASDKERLKKIQILNDSDSLIFQIERSLGDFGDKVSESDRESINSIIEDLKKARENEDVTEIESKMKELSEEMSKVSASVYASQDQSAPDDSKSSENSEDNSMEDIEFEEVQER